MSEVFRHGDNVNVDVSKTSDNSLLHSPRNQSAESTK